MHSILSRNVSIHVSSFPQFSHSCSRDRVPDSFVSEAPLRDDSQDLWPCPEPNVVRCYVSELLRDDLDVNSVRLVPV